MNWDDLRFALAIHRLGTLSAAAQALGVNQTTAARRLDRLEAALGLRLFDRVAGRMVVRAEGERALDRVARMEEDALAVLHGLRNRDDDLAGTVRVTSLPSFTARFLAPRLKDFLDRHPDIRVELVAAASNLDLGRREADVAIRFARPQNGAALVRKLGHMGFAAYGRADLPVAASGDLAALPWAGYDDSLAHLPEAQWLAHEVRPAQMRATATDVMSLLELTRAGTCVAVLPCIVGDTEKALRRLTGPQPVASREMWLLMHPDLKRVRRVRALVEWLEQAVAADRAALEGTG
ncbi:LysR family transcriptional regulator [Novispirillum sp. DQ9]|uniref:LysR family transcriptional regulator n=1 Tax=Novispirillum sp. DQ9 TaxID=3398612 RepID=UPI003C7AE3C3